MKQQLIYLIWYYTSDYNNVPFEYWASYPLKHTLEFPEDRTVVNKLPWAEFILTPATYNGMPIYIQTALIG